MTKTHTEPRYKKTQTRYTVLFLLQNKDEISTIWGLTYHYIAKKKHQIATILGFRSPGIQKIHSPKRYTSNTFLMPISLHASGALSPFVAGFLQPLVQLKPDLVLPLRLLLAARQLRQLLRSKQPLRDTEKEKQRYDNETSIR